jgi:alpha-tubulin suppressor-like RCC1 family protein
MKYRGANASGQLGLGDQRSRYRPEKIQPFCDEKIVGVYAGGHEEFGFSLIMCEKSIYTFGQNSGMFSSHRI